MNAGEIDDLAWASMKALTDAEVLAHPALAGRDFENLWDARIALRDRFRNELFADLFLAGLYEREERVL